MFVGPASRAIIDHPDKPSQHIHAARSPDDPEPQQSAGALTRPQEERLKELVCVNVYLFETATGPSKSRGQEGWWGGGQTMKANRMVLTPVIIQEARNAVRLKQRL